MSLFTRLLGRCRLRMLTGLIGVVATAFMSTGRIGAQTPYPYTVFGTFVSWFSPYCGYQCMGPFGVAFDAQNNFYVVEGFNSTFPWVPTNQGYSVPLSGRIFKFASHNGQPAGGTLDQAIQVSEPIPGARDIIFDRDGHLFVTEGLALTYQHYVDQLDPVTLTVIKRIELPANPWTGTEELDPTGLALAANGVDLYVSTSGVKLVRIAAPASANPDVSIFWNPGPYGTGSVAVGPSGKIYASGYAITPTPDGSAVESAVDLGIQTAWQSDGMVISADETFMLLTTNVGPVFRVDLVNHVYGAGTVVADTGSRGTLAIAGPDGCVYASLSASVMRMTDNTGACFPAMARRNPNFSPVPTDHPPVAVDDATTTSQNTPVTVNVLANDSDPDGDPLTITGVGTALSGTVTFTGTSVAYTPNPGFAGLTDTFTYTINDGHDRLATARVFVSIPAAPVPPGVVVPPTFGVTRFASNLGVKLAGMTFDATGNLIVADKGNFYDFNTADGRILTISPTGVGRVLSTSGGMLQDPAGVAFGPGGAWGTGLYFVDENAYYSYGGVFRDTPAGDFSVVALSTPFGAGYSQDNRLAFGRGNGFGTDLYVTDMSDGNGGLGNGGTGGIYTVAPDGTRTPWLSGAPLVDPYGIAFGPGGAFGTDMYVADYGDFGGTGYIWRIDAAKNVTRFAGGPGSPLISPNDLAFGPGGDFGTDLYVRDFDAGKVFRISSTGQISTFLSGLSIINPPADFGVGQMHGGLVFDPSGSCLYVVNGPDILKACSNVSTTPTCSTTVAVPGTANPYLAGMPVGSTDAGWDSVPADSPAQVTGVPVAAGQAYQFAATGSVSFGPGPSGVGPDGYGGGPHSAGASNGIASISAPWDSLIGVFVDDSQPDLSPAPAGADFVSNPGSRDYSTLAPLLKQPFFIGDGVDASGHAQTVIAPPGATRLFLGMQDGFGWFNNSGSFSVAVTTACGNSNAPATVTSTWHADGTANDAAGLNNGTALNGTTYGDGVQGQAFSLDGAHAYVEVPISTPAMNEPESFTWEAWVNPTTLVGSPVVFSKELAVTNRAGLQITSDGALCSYMNSSGCAALSAPGLIPTCSFTKVTLLYDGATHDFVTYVNGVEASRASVTAPYHNDAPFNIGLSPQGFGNTHFHGLIDEVTFSTAAVVPTVSASLPRSCPTADLEATGVSLSAMSINTAEPGAALTVTAAVRNIGGIAAVGHQDRTVILTADRQPLDSDPVAIGTYYFAGGGINPGDSYSMSLTFSHGALAALAPGSYYACWEANYWHPDMVEPNYGNNWACTPLTITHVPADLTPTALTLPVPVVDVGLVTSTLEVRATIANIGGATATGHQDRIAILNSSRQPLDSDVRQFNLYYVPGSDPAPGAFYATDTLVPRSIFVGLAPGSYVVCYEANWAHSDLEESRYDNNWACAPVTVVDSSVPTGADLEVTKNGPVFPIAGKELTYVVKVKNNGPEVATNVVVDDTFPNGLQFVSVTPGSPTCSWDGVRAHCNVGTLAVGQIATVTIVARAPQPGPVHNDATAHADQPDGNPGNNTGGVDSDIVPPKTGLGFSKGVEWVVGPRLKYTITVENQGPTVAHNVVAKDLLDPGWILDPGYPLTTKGVCDTRVVCSIGDLAVGEKQTVTFIIGLLNPVPGATVHNDAYGSCDECADYHAGADAQPAPDLRVSKAHLGNFVQGGQGSYTISVANVGTGPTTDVVTVTDTLPAGLSFASGGGDGFTCSAAGATVTCVRTTPIVAGGGASFTLVVNVSPTAPALVTNYVGIRGGGLGGVWQPDAYGDGTTIVRPAGLGIVKKVSATTITVGQNLTYLIDITNTGGVDAHHVTVIDAIPAGSQLANVVPGAPICTMSVPVTCDLGDLAPGQTKEVEIDVVPTTVTVLSNQAFGSADGITPVGSGTVTTQVVGGPDLSLTKTASAPVVIEDSTLIYTIVVKNLGPGAATNVRINDPLPRGVELVQVTTDPTYGMTCNVTAPPVISNLSGPVICTVPSLPALTTSTLVLKVHVLVVGPLGNTACVSSDVADPTAGNNCSTATTRVDARPKADPHGPYTVPEGSTVRLIGTGTGIGGRTTGLVYSWDLDGNGTFETTGANPIFSAVTLDGPLVPAVYPVTLRVCDGAVCATAQTTVSVTNVAPTITSLTASSPAYVGQPVAIATVATDVAGPVRDPLTYRFDCNNDGTWEIGPQAAPTTACVFANPGTYVVRVQASDSDGGTDTRSITVVVSPRVCLDDDHGERAHRDGDECDHERHRNGHRDGDGCDHERRRSSHRTGDACDHERGRFGHHRDDGCEHESAASRECDDDAGSHRDGDGCDHDRGRNGHRAGDGCAHDRQRRS